MLLRYGDEVRSGERALKAGLAPGAAGSGGAGGWVPFWAAGAAWVAGVDMFAPRRRRACAQPGAAAHDALGRGAARQLPRGWAAARPASDHVARPGGGRVGSRKNDVLLPPLLCRSGSAMLLPLHLVP